MPTATTQPELSVQPEVSDVAVPERAMTAEEFEKWLFAQEFARCEWVEGEIIVMAPVSDWHSDLNRWLIALLSVFVEERDLGVIRYDMLFRMPDRRRVPDLFVIRKENLGRLQPTALDGPADIAVEIVSPDSGARDWREKYLEYEAVGVGEYWVIDPMAQKVECYALADDRKFHLTVVEDDKIASVVLPGFYLRPSWLWQKPLPRVVGALKEMGVQL